VQEPIWAKPVCCRSMRCTRSEVTRIGTKKRGVNEQIDLQELNPSEAKIIKDLEVIALIMDTVPDVLANAKNDPSKAQETLKILNVTKVKLQPVLANANKFSMTVKEYLQQFSNKLNGSIKRLSEFAGPRDQHQPTNSSPTIQQTPFDMINDPFPNHRTPFDFDREPPKDTNPFAIKFNPARNQREGLGTNPFEIPTSELDNRRLNAQGKTQSRNQDVDFLNLEPNANTKKHETPFDIWGLDHGAPKQQNQKSDNLLDLDFLQ
jgi:hypothetical protein